MDLDNIHETEKCPLHDEMVAEERVELKPSAFYPLGEPGLVWVCNAVGCEYRFVEAFDPKKFHRYSRHLLR